MLNLGRLQVLCEVVSRGSFSAAADALSYTQSAVSQAIARLEAETGATLVVRDRRGNILFAVDHSARITIIGKPGGDPSTFPEVTDGVQKPIPEGCEGAFSPYVEPSKAHILGRCLSFNVESERAFS